MDEGTNLEQEFIQEEFFKYLKSDDLGPAFDIYESVDHGMKDRLFYFVCGLASASIKTNKELIDTLKKMTEND